MIPVVIRVLIPVAVAVIGAIFYMRTERNHHTNNSNLHQQPSGFFNCVLCLKSFNAFEKKCVLSCSHFLHKECAETLLTQGTNTCPLCRKQVSSKSL